jgi:hypothetical protein
MERKKKIPLPDGRLIEGTIVDVTSSQESWNQYLLSDGTVVKMKPVATEILRIDGEYDAEGNPTYVIRSTNVTSVIAPETLKKQI